MINSIYSFKFSQYQKDISKRCIYIKQKKNTNSQLFLTILRHSLINPNIVSELIVLHSLVAPHYQKIHA